MLVSRLAPEPTMLTFAARAAGTVVDAADARAAAEIIVYRQTEL